MEILDLHATHLHDVSENLIGDGVLLLDVGELLAEPERVGLEVQIGVLATGNLVLVHVRVAGLHGDGALERRVQKASLLPVGAVLVHSLGVDAYTKRDSIHVKRRRKTDTAGVGGGWVGSVT